jgi:heat shock protein HtpX
MMFVSMLPALLYYIGFSLMLSTGSRRKEGSGDLGIVAIAFMAFSWILNLFILYLSRLREYYADRHSATIVSDGPGKLSVALAKIVQASRSMGRTKKEAKNQNAFKALFITDPDHAEVDSTEIRRLASASGEHRLVEEIMSHQLTTADKLKEVFSTHPNMTKRLKALQELN